MVTSCAVLEAMDSLFRPVTRPGMMAYLVHTPRHFDTFTPVWALARSDQFGFPILRASQQPYLCCFARLMDRLIITSAKHLYHISTGIATRMSVLTISPSFLRVQELLAHPHRLAAFPCRGLVQHPDAPCDMLPDLPASWSIRSSYHLEPDVAVE